ncbi:MAG: peptidase M15 [Xanthobacteraceae bacterium]
MRARRFAVLAALGGTAVLAGGLAIGVAGFGSRGIENTDAVPIGERGARGGATSLTADAGPVDGVPATATASVAAVATADADSTASTGAPAAMSVGEALTADPDPPEPAFVLAGVSAAAAPVAAAPLPEARPPPPPEKRVQLASLFTSDPEKEYPKPAVRLVEIPNECLVAEICIDEYLWSLYERTPKVDTNKVLERVKVKVKTKKGKTRTVTKTNTKYVIGDFTWKDPISAQKAGMSLKDYVIGGMDRGFKLKLYRAARVMEDAGLMPGITSAFRDDYRQAIASGNKAASDSSYHGGSRRGGYGHGLAADLVSVKGETRMQRYASSEELWKWIDAHEKELGVGRPYLDRDPPHVGPIDGREYAVKRGGRAHVQKAGLQTKHAQKARLETKKRRLAARNDPGVAKRAKPQKSSKVSSLQNRASVQR